MVCPPNHPSDGNLNEVNLGGVMVGGLAMLGAVNPLRINVVAGDVTPQGIGLMALCLASEQRTKTPADAGAWMFI